MACRILALVDGAYLARYFGSHFGDNYLITHIHLSLQRSDLSSEEKYAWPSAILGQAIRKESEPLQGRTKIKNPGPYIRDRDQRKTNNNTVLWMGGAQVETPGRSTGSWIIAAFRLPGCLHPVVFGSAPHLQRPHRSGLKPEFPILPVYQPGHLEPVSYSII
jgi:hypothetical protein